MEKLPEHSHKKENSRHDMKQDKLNETQEKNQLSLDPDIGFQDIEVVRYRLIIMMTIFNKYRKRWRLS
jgi:hypothetical protein